MTHLIDDLNAITENRFLKMIAHDYLNACLDKNFITIKSFSKDEILHFDGDICSYVEFILTGCVLVERIDESGNLLTITEFYPDDIVGGNLIFSKNPHYPMTITAKKDVKIVTISKDQLFELCSTNTSFLSLYLEYISDQALFLGDKIKHYVNRTIRESVVAYLKNETKLQNSNIIRLNITKKALADRMGVQRTSLSREFQKMKKEGLIDFDGSSITILDSKLLK